VVRSPSDASCVAVTRNSWPSHQRIVESMIWYGDGDLEAVGSLERVSCAPSGPKRASTSHRTSTDLRSASASSVQMTTAPPGSPHPQIEYRIAHTPKRGA
jgi:hypothetical protein